MNLSCFFKTLGRVSTSVFLMLSLNACTTAKPPSAVETGVGKPRSSSFVSSTLCAENAFLQKYECSFSRIEQVARSGDPDAQYALGYLYYYGVGTTQDRQTGLVWIRRAAAQGQTVAQEALKALSKSPQKTPVGAGSVPPSSSQTNSSRTSAAASVSTTNNSSTGLAAAGQPEKPLTDYLPNYGQKRVNVTETPPSVNLSTSPNDTTQSQ